MAPNVEHAIARSQDARSLLCDVIGGDDGVTVDYIIGLLSEDGAEAERAEAVDAAAELIGAHVDELSEEQRKAVAERVAVLAAASSMSELTSSFAEISHSVASDPGAASSRRRGGAGSSSSPQLGGDAVDGSDGGVAPGVTRDDDYGEFGSSDAADTTPSVLCLRELVPQASSCLCEYALRLCADDVSDAVEMLLGTEDISALESKASRDALARASVAKQRAAAERKAQQDTRKHILRRNDLVRDHKADGTEMKLSAPRLPYAASRKEALRGTGVRYLDGQVIATKGERHVVVQETTEWDGGSTGKVITKGKRGKGFR